MVETGRTWWKPPKSGRFRARSGRVRHLGRRGGPSSTTFGPDSATVCPRSTKVTSTRFHRGSPMSDLLQSKARVHRSSHRPGRSKAGGSIGMLHRAGRPKLGPGLRGSRPERVSRRTGAPPRFTHRFTRRSRAPLAKASTNSESRERLSALNSGRPPPSSLRPLPDPRGPTPRDPWDQAPTEIPGAS